MLEFVVVDRPTIWPNLCVATNTATGPMVDTHRELNGWGRVYISKDAILRANKALGLTKGKRYDELLAAGETVGRLETEVAELIAANAERDATVATLERENKNLNELLVDKESRITQLENALRSEVESTLAVLNAG